VVSKFDIDEMILLSSSFVIVLFSHGLNITKKFKKYLKLKEKNRKKNNYCLKL